MGERFEVQLVNLFKNLEDVLNDPADVIMIKQIVLDRLTSAGAGKTAEPPSINKLARDIFRVSRQRNDILGENCCPDPEWNMLLDLVIAKIEERSVDVTGLCIASGVPATTALRHIDRMTKAGLVRRQACSTDKRRQWIEATPRALTATEDILRQCYAAGTV